MHIYINKETEELLIKLASSGIYKKNTASYVLKYLVEKEIKYTENTLRKIEEQQEREEQLKQKFGSIENVMTLAQEDWVNVEEEQEDEEQEDWVEKAEREYKKRLLEEEQDPKEEETEEDWNSIANEIQKWKEHKKNDK